MRLALVLSFLFAGCGSAASDPLGDAAPPDEVDASADSGPLADCGDEVKELNEECDDGNSQDGDGCSAECLQESAGWQQISAAAGPQERYGAAMVHDRARGLAVLFGGHSDPAFHDDTWEWNGSSWQLRDLEEGPGERRWHAMAYDSDRQRTVLFGGNGAPAAAADTWEFDGSTWIERDLEGPAGRWGHGMAYDEARGVLVLFGGFTPDERAMNDTWEFDGAAWTRVDTSSSPPPRLFHGMTYDPVRERVVVFGGNVDYGSFEFRSDTWEYDGQTWVELDAGEPPARSAPSLAFHETLGSLVLFGGMTADTSTWTLTDGTWSEHADLSSPSSRTEASAIYDRDRRKLVVFGGRLWYSSYAVLGDTWELGLQ